MPKNKRLTQGLIGLGASYGFICLLRDAWSLYRRRKTNPTPSATSEPALSTPSTTDLEVRRVAIVDAIDGKPLAWRGGILPFGKPYLPEHPSLKVVDDVQLLIHVTVDGELWVQDPDSSGGNYLSDGERLMVGINYQFFETAEITMGHPQKGPSIRLSKRPDGSGIYEFRVRTGTFDPASDKFRKRITYRM